MDSHLPPENNPPPVPPATPPVFPKPPPVISSSTPARPARKGTGWMILAIILLVLLCFSIVGNFRGAVGGVSSGRIRNYRAYGPRLDEAIMRDSSSPDKIAVIPIEGIITGQVAEQGAFNMPTVIKEELKRASMDRNVRAVILKVDSPGGEVLASDEIANAVEDFETNNPGKPVVVSMGSLAASGGYYVSARSDWIVANELTITGSIGVIMQGLNYRGLMDKIGLLPEVFKSGKYKDMLSGSKEPNEITPEERAMVQKLIDETFEKFKSVVGEGRSAAYQYSRQKGRKLASDWADYADGRILSGKEAYKLGFVDELGDFDAAVDRAKRLASVSKAKVVEYQQVFDLSSFFHLFGKSDAKAVKVDLGLDSPRLRPGCLYFLMSTDAH